ncbi:MAG: hypothetical protein NC241_06935 [Bacteroides sp.]|nr:hypothetical protein [Bacteroides sp.]MCM1457531.1 hypothetical protein [Lachnoclostridium sp.]
MKFKFSGLFAFVAATIITGLAAGAQNSTLTPYSRYGYGILSDNATSAQRAMGGVGYAMNSGRQINVMNPASYAAVDSLTFLFDMGVDFTSLWSKEGTTSENNFGGGLDYITMLFPVTKYMGVSLGILPYSSVGYSFGSEIDNGATARQGSGSINQAYVGWGATPFKNFYAGFNFSYLFGNTVNDVYAYTITGSTSLFQREMKVRDWHLDIGLQYSFDIKPENRVTLGVTYSPGKSLHGETYGVYYDTNLDTKPDTVGFTKLNGLYSIPASYGAGINYQWRNRLMVEADFTYQPWKDAKYAPIENFEVTEFSNRWKIGAGVQYTPSPRGSYFQRVQYRLGGYYNHDYLMILGNNIREYGASVGFGFPVPGFKSVVNLGIEYKHRQANPNPLIKEQYLNITLGINFNEMWFRKAKIY